jgi:hypothetical protein
MTKDQGIAIVQALQAGFEYISTVQYKLEVGKVLSETPGENLINLTTTFEDVISEIITNFPDDSGGGGGGGVSGKMPINQIVNMTALQADNPGSMSIDE